MSIIHSASHVAISGGNLVASGPRSTVMIHHGGQLGVSSSAFKDLSAATAHTALHDSAARFDAPRCHRNTRAKYRDRLELWMVGKREEFEWKQLIWVYGGAGAGKSAIMQSVVEQCAQHGTILGCFFFSRADPSRNYAEVLIPTLAYQVAHAFPEAMVVLDPVIQRNPLIFKASLQTQAVELLVRPLMYLVENGFIDSTSLLRKVFVIDGLDECSDPRKQALIIRVISSMLCEHGLPICFLIASRLEIAISSAFDQEKQLHGKFATITLDNDNNAQSDIRQFIEDSFLDIIDTHPLRHYINLPWPDPLSIHNLAWNSSGHFIYAATAMKFIASPDEHPERALKVVEGLVSSRTGSPFEALDALYVHIITSARYSKQVLEILRHCYLSPLANTVAAVCYIHDISPQDISLFLSEVQSLVSLTLDNRLFGELSIAPKHASLGDFFGAEERSGILYISEEVYHAGLLARHFQLLDQGPRTSSFCFRHSDEIQSRRTTHYYWLDSDVHHLILALVHGIIYSNDTEVLQSLVSRHTPHDIWNFCLESITHDTLMSGADIRTFILEQVAGYMCAIRDSIGLQDDSPYFDQFKMYLELSLDDLNDIVQQKPHYRIIPALMFTGTQSGLSAARELLYRWGHRFRINRTYRHHFWKPLSDKGSKTDPRAFKAIRHLPHSRLSWTSDLAVAMKLVLRRLMSLPWRGPSDPLYSSPHRRWLRHHKPSKRVSVGFPRLSSSLVIAYRIDGKAFRRVLAPSKPGNLLSLRSRIWKQENIMWRSNCPALLKAIIHYLRKSDHTSEVLRLAKRPLPIATQWFPKLMKRARYEMDDYVSRWQGPSDRVLKKAKLQPASGTV